MQDEDRAQAMRHGRERGASLIEYALLVALIAVVCTASLVYFGDARTESFSRTASAIDATG